MSVLNAYQKANTPHKVEPQTFLVTDDTIHLRKPLEEGIFKINTDVAQASDYRWGAGVVIREVYAAAVRQIFCGLKLRLAETLGLRLGLGLVQDMSFRRVSIGSDCKELIEALLEERDSPSYFPSIVRECISISNNFFSCSFSHARRGGNRVAHRLAKIACNHDNIVCVEDYPHEVAPLVIADCTDLSFS